MKTRARAGGFTLIELTVAVVVMGMVVSVIYKSVGPMLAWKARADTENKLSVLKTAIETGYRQNIRTIDADNAARLSLGAAGNIDPTPVNGDGYCTPADGYLAPLAPFLASAPDIAIRDGYNLRFCVMVEARLVLAYNGQNLPYHPVAIVSGGPNGVIDAGTQLAGGQLTLAADDQGVMADSAGLVVAAYERTQTALAKASAALQQYFAARYQSDPSRNAGTDYFGCGAAACPGVGGNWDTNNGLPSTCAGPVDMATTAIGVVGLVREDVTDGFGRVLQYDNCGAGVRSPSNAAAAMQTPPFTAVIQTTLPDGTQLIATAVGQAY